MPRGSFHEFHFAKVCPSLPSIATAQSKSGINQVRNRVGASIAAPILSKWSVVNPVVSEISDLGFAVEPRVSRNDSRGKRPPNPEAQKVAPAVEGIPQAAGRPEVQWTADPGTAANDTLQVPD